MRRSAVLVALVVLLSCTGAFGATYWVAATGGADDGSHGTQGAPWATLNYAVQQVSAGDTINVRAGNYTQHLYWADGPNGSSGSPITIQAYDGSGTAHFVGESGTANTFWLVDRTYITIVGLDVAASQSSGYYCIKMEGSSTGALNHVTLKNCYFHDSGQGDVVKGTPGVTYLTVDGCEIAYPGGGSPSGNNQCIDNVAVDYGWFKNNYMHDYPDIAFYTKGGSQYVVAENNVISNPGKTPVGPAAGFGQETDQEWMEPGATYQSYYMVMRNNIFTNCTGGAVGSYSCYHGYFYNNLVFNCGTVSGDYGLVWQRETGDDWTPDTAGFYIYNNIFCDTRGQMPSVYRYQSGTYSDWQHDYNNFYNGGSAIPTGGMFDPTHEAHSTFGDPHLSMSGGTPSTWQGWVNYYRPAWDTQSNNMLKDKGVSAGGAQPGVTADIDGNSRPQNGAWDIGPYEKVGVSQPVANFTGTPTSGYSPLGVSFTDTSTNAPTSWSWTFGDGGTSTSENPAHSYTATGSYTVALTATNSAGGNTNTKANYITVNALPSPPVANFSGTPTSGPAPLSVTFTDSSSNNPTAWSWTFGDSSTSTAQNPSHTFSAGTYTVALTATNAGGSNTSTKSNYISAAAPAPVANFTANVTSGVAPLAVTFTDQSSNSPTAWSWVFGDSSTSTVQSPSHTYSAAGYYTVSLTASNSAGSNTNTKTNYITACTEVIIYPALWETNNNWGAQVSLVSGALADVQSDNGVYMVFRTNQTSWNSFFRYRFQPTQQPSQINNMILEYQWKDSRSDTPTYQNSIKKADGTFYETAWRAWTTTDQTWTWSATDPATYFYNNGGTTEIWVDNCGCHQNTNSYDTSVDLLRIHFWMNPSSPVANFSGTPTSGTKPLAVTFTDQSTGNPTAWSWNFGDSSTSTVHNPSHTYNNAGNYTVALTATNASGNDTCTKANYITATVAAPVANFSGTPTSGAKPLTVTFTDSSTNTPTAWSWTFGDSSTSTVQNPSHSYANAGSYTVALTATNAGGNNTMTKTNYLTVTNPAPVANFSGTPTSGTAPLDVTFTDTSTNTPTAWTWTFGDSNSSNLQNPIHTYTAAGSYTVALTATNAGGNNTNTKSSYISVTSGGSAPVASFTANVRVGLAALAVTFTDTSTNSPTVWSWNFGDGNTSTVRNPSHTYNAQGYYTVSLKATNAAGNNTDTESNYITVCTEALIYPYTYDSSFNTVTLQSGSLTDLQTDNGSYMVFRCNQTNYRYFVRFKWTPGYTPSQIYKLAVEYQWKNSSAVQPTFENSVKKADGSFYETTWRVWTTTDQTWNWEATDPATYFYNNEIWVDLCGCNQNSTSYDVSVDVCRIHLWLYPQAPAADFSGTPTSGTAPLAVTFTDASTNNPTAWSWNFGDSNTSTAQNPAHTYLSNGSYTVALTATNSVGGNTNTKSNYVTASSATAIYSESFESQFAGWVSTGTPDWFTGTPKNGTHDIQLLGGGTAESISRIINTNGYTGIQVSFYMAGKSLDSTSEYISASWYSGSTWTELKRIKGGDSDADGTLRQYSYSLPSGADNNANFQLKFNIVGSATDDYGYVDDIVVSGTGNSKDVWRNAYYWDTNNGSTLSAGSLSDTNTDNGVCMQMHDNPSGHSFNIRYWFQAGYNPAQISKLAFDFKFRDSRSDTPNASILIYKPAGGYDTIVASGLWGTADKWATFSTTSPSTYLYGDNSIITQICGCPVSGNNNDYDVYVDTVRLRVTLP